MRPATSHGDGALQLGWFVFSPAVAGPALAGLKGLLRMLHLRSGPYPLAWLPERCPLTPAVRHACHARCLRPNQPLGCHAPGSHSLTPAPGPLALAPTRLPRSALAETSPSPPRHQLNLPFHRGPKHSTAAREMPDSQPEAAPVFVLALYSQHVGPPTVASCVSPPTAPRA
eukprot:scaffold92532_cov70-Phaeocystis_antarctica.AAC.2